ncbi:MAG: beta-eliminating lyase-related protein [Acidimicrobiia bacterium]|nr:beta-eliminating lyase-related protein [Acidimicrobiia bacterium]
MAFPDGIADFRSDTVTRPTEEMRRAMAAAEVGDDVYGEDPTVAALQEEAAAALGTEAALFVPSGTMGNQIAVNLHTRPGDEIVCNDWAHVRNHEHGAASWLSGVGFRSVPGDGGMVSVDQITAATEQSAYHLPGVSLLVWENSHNVSGGSVVPLAAMQAGTAAARRAGLAVHLDGARIFNAVAASGVAAAAFAAEADTVMFCLSKGLGAPVGSMLCGTADAMAAAQLVRKRLGGGMRQSGVIAAAGRIGLRDRDRLGDDHRLAVRLAALIEERLPGSVLQPPETNMVLVGGDVIPGGLDAFVAALGSEGVLTGYIRSGVLRFCTHRDVDGTDAERVAAVAAAMAG